MDISRIINDNNSIVEGDNCSIYEIIDNELRSSICNISAYSMFLDEIEEAIRGIDIDKLADNIKNELVEHIMISMPRDMDTELVMTYIYSNYSDIEYCKLSNSEGINLQCVDYNGLMHSYNMKYLTVEMFDKRENINKIDVINDIISGDGNEYMINKIYELVMSK